MAGEVERREIEVAGLEKPVEILIDPWGIPHIYAETLHDVFFGQGWNAARDRLWQMDLWRKRGLGRLAANFGPAYIEQDRASRLFLYRGDMDAEWTAYGPDAKAWTTAFVEGINAYVAAVLTGEAATPVEFRLTGSKPERWTPEELVRLRTHNICNNVESEALRMRVASADGVAADRIRRRLEPEHEATLPAGLDLTDIPADLIAPYLKAREEVSFAALAAPGAAEEARAPEAAEIQGSNNWAISPARSATGRPILASDPHRVLGAPSIRYVSHLAAPGLNVIGSAELHLPGVTIGHNEKVAFGITVFMADQSDLHVYELNPENPRQYRYDGGWESMRVVNETIEVKREAPREIELLFTRHGPVLKYEPHRNRAFALRTVWFEPGTSSYFCATRYQRAENWTEFRHALANWRAAPMNFVYADVDGNIGWQPAGLMPRRRDWDGLAGAPGDGRYEWDGFATQDELPHQFNPARGWVGSANEMNLPPNSEAETFNIGYEWADPGRMQRIAEVLDANDRVTLEDCARLHVDVKCVRARQATALLGGLRSADPKIIGALELLAGWDGRESADSAAAAIAEVWMAKHLSPALARRATTPAAAKVLTAACSPSGGSAYAAVSYLEGPGQALGPDVRKAILTESLAAALAELTERLGPDMEAWRWGDLHHARFVPAAAALAEPALREKMTHGPARMPGSAYTVNAATYRIDDFAMTNGASFRMVVDVGDWDNSLVINTPGQSGDPQSPHYGDLFPLWAQGKYVPMLYSRGAVEKAARQAIDLRPAGSAR
jgi:penicillin amidase